jgi:hypothetical protein
MKAKKTPCHWEWAAYVAGGYFLHSLVVYLRESSKHLRALWGSTSIGQG